MGCAVSRFPQANKKAQGNNRREKELQNLAKKNERRYSYEIIFVCMSAFCLGVVGLR